MKSVCLDFDGVIHAHTSPWEKSDMIPDPPVPGAFDFIRHLMKGGFNVFVMSCRFHRQVGAPTEDKNLEAVFDWFVKHGAKDLIDTIGEVKSGQPQLFFVVKKPVAILYIDDRAFHFKGEWPSLDEIDNFKPWNK